MGKPTHTLTHGKLPFSHGWSAHLLTGKKKADTWKHTQSLMNISYTHVGHVDTGSTLCGPLAVCITGCFKANYNKNKQAKHFLWCLLPRTILGPRPETIRGRGDTGASVGGEEEGETEKVLKVCFCGRYFTFTASINQQLQLAPSPRR